MSFTTKIKKYIDHIILISRCKLTENEIFNIFINLNEDDILYDYNIESINIINDLFMWLSQEIETKEQRNNIIELSLLYLQYILKMMQIFISKIIINFDRNINHNTMKKTITNHYNIIQKLFPYIFNDSNYFIDNFIFDDYINTSEENQYKINELSEFFIMSNIKKLIEEEKNITKIIYSIISFMTIVLNKINILLSYSSFINENYEIIDNHIKQMIDVNKHIDELYLIPNINKHMIKSIFPFIINNDQINIILGWFNDEKNKWKMTEFIIKIMAFINIEDVDISAKINFLHYLINLEDMIKTAKRRILIFI